MSLPLMQVADTASSAPAAVNPNVSFLTGGGAAGALIRGHDWSRSPLGHPENWSTALKTLVSVMLGANQPMFIVWGPERTLLYNTRYIDILACKHPSAMGRDFLEVWSEIQADLLPIVDQAYRGEAVQMDDIELWMERKGFREETHFSFSYTPIRADEGDVTGFFCACQEITDAVIAKRRLQASEEQSRADQKRVQLALEAGAIIGTWFWDLPTDRFTIDEQFARSFGIDPARVHDGLSLEQVVETVHPEDQPGLAAAIAEVVARGGRYAHQYRVRRADGRYYWIEANGRVEHGPDGTPLSFPGVLIDVEARRQVEAERDQAATLLRTFVDAVPGVAYAKDRQGRMLVANKGTAALIGKPPEAFLGKTDAEFLDNKEQAAAITANDERIMASGVAEQIEEEVSLPDGSHAVWFSTKAPLLSESGDVVGLIGSSIDITARKAVEAAFAQSEERFRLALDAAGGIGTWDWDVATDKVITSRQFAEMYGLDPEQAAHGVPLSEYVKGIHPEDRAEVARLIEEAVRNGGDYRAEYRICGSAGEWRWVIARGRSLLDEQGRPTRFSGVTFDITDRRKAEEALQQTTQRLDAILNNTRMAVFLMDDRQHCVYANAAAETLTGYSFAELSAKPLHDVIHNKKPDGSHYPLEECPIDRAFPERAQVGGEELFVAPDGSFYPVAFTASPLRDDAGTAIGTVIEARNIAEEKARDAALRELNETLERRVVQAIAEREKAEEALRQSQKMEAVGQLTGGIAHDFNNLLTVVTGNIEMASRALGSAGLSEGRIKRSLDNAMKGAERAASLTQRLLAFSRRQPLDPKPLDVDRLVAGMSDLLNRSLGEMVKLEVVTSPGLWRVEADPNQLESAILNLAVNARDAMPEGGTLTVETANARLDESYAAEHAEVAPGQYVVIAVTDTGEGMSKEIAARVFEPFFTTKEVGRGTGLGLSQVYGFTKQSGGHVKIYSEPGQGTTVKLYLPRLLSDVEAEEEQERPVAEVSRAQETILVVEDDDDVRAYTVECLRELGYRVIEAHDGPSALRLLERQEAPIDLLFTDVVMPGMTGRELADHARAVQPDLKVLYTSGYTRNAIVHGGRLDEGVEMISKPFTYATLAEKVADVLEIGRTGRVLLVEEDATVRMFAGEALAAAGYAVDEAAGSAEALGRMRAARGRYDAVVLDVSSQERGSEALAAELRAMHADLPILLATNRHEELAERTAADRCTAVIAKPYNAARLTSTLQALGVRCRAAHER